MKKLHNQFILLSSTKSAQGFVFNGSLGQWFEVGNQ